MKFTFRKVEPSPGVAAAEWGDWRWHFRHGLSTVEDFARYFELSAAERLFLERPQRFPVLSTPYYAALADRLDARDVIRRMILPDGDEAEGRGQQISDPLGERRHSPADRLVHRYPDRVLFLVTDQCSLYCRYCLRKHFTGQGEAFIGSFEYSKALEYIARAPGVREVILSGGDPLTLSDDRIARVLADLRKIDHIEIIRIASRMPVVCPMRVTTELAGILRLHKPVFFMTHFNHPREVTAESARCLDILVDHGIPVFNQMVLLNGVNNHPAIVQALARRLLFLRVKPYYMFQCDPSEGSEHFRTSVEESEAIQRELWGWLSGLAMANLSLDIPGGGGKVGLVPDFESGRSESGRRYVGFDGVHGEYLLPCGPSLTPPDVDLYLPEWREIMEQNYGRG